MIIVTNMEYFIFVALFFHEGAKKYKTPESTSMLSGVRTDNTLVGAKPHTS
ncbi:hypothetical protein [uncultured Desulfobacter sp.]|uniref:hypothetical protein n=1 Tax=uncultured Desulfobacter sp. TaxID=240139 RepID=UPI002AAA6D53|nr:hypothetical protein [uncultured Desulfobacter sp.]